MNHNALFELLEQRFQQYCQPQFVETDPVQIPHLFTRKEDIEIAGFLAATIAWGNRKAIIQSARKLMDLMDNAPYDFIMNASDRQLQSIEQFVYRTFQPDDCLFFLESLRNIYANHGGLQQVFEHGFQQSSGSMFETIAHFRDVFITTPHLSRSEKHLADVRRGSSAKRINMFLRWMVRSNDGIDFGLWHAIPTSALRIPLDVHSGRTARSLGLLSRKANDWRAVEELTSTLREFDPNDPIKYDFALFGIGVFEGGISLDDK